MSNVSNVKVYGLYESFRASKFPMAVDTDNVDDCYTARIKKLAKAAPGSGHDNFLKGIVVQFDLKFTPKMSVELERYHFIDFVSSQSTMHRITQFDLDKAYIEYVDPRVIEVMKEKINWYNLLDKNTEEAKRLYLEILYTNPCGMLLTARLTTNYQQLKTIYSQRETHRLPEWREFCAWIETLPLARDLIIREE